MLEAEIKIVNQLGLHARAAAQLVKLSSKFESKILLVREDESITADAKSILSVLALAASKGAILKLEVDGVDEEQALCDVQKLFSDRFGEDL
jgi:phosphotransferase system HPr (HPr) family protein